MSIHAVQTGRYEPDQSGRYAAPIGGSPVIADETPYSAALRCMATYTSRRPLRIAVGEVADYTGAKSETGGGRITQGGALMAMSALAKAGVPLVERFDTSVADLESKYASDRPIDGERPRQWDAKRGFAGFIPGSDYYLVGGITELNVNVYSEGDSIAPGSGAYIMNIGLDLRLVDSRSLEVMDVISYQKQIAGYRESGVVEFLGHNFDAGSGDSALEPVQLAVRSVIERAVLEMVSRLYRAPARSCASAIGTAADPLAGPDDRLAAASVLHALPQAPAPNQPDDHPQMDFGRTHPRDSVAPPHLRRSLD